MPLLQLGGGFYSPVTGVRTMSPMAKVKRMIPSGGGGCKPDVEMCENMFLLKWCEKLLGFESCVYHTKNTKFLFERKYKSNPFDDLIANRISIRPNVKYPSSIGCIDMDWFTTLVSKGRGSYDSVSARYERFKRNWCQIRKNHQFSDTGKPQYPTAPYSDRGETMAVKAVADGFTFESLWPDSYLDRICVGRNRAYMRLYE